MSLRFPLSILLLGCLAVGFVDAQTTNPLPARAPAERLDGPPLVTAKGWAIADGKTGKLLWSGRANAPLPMASTTKIMTAWIVLQLAKENPQLLDELVTISEHAAKTAGSSAKIRTGEKYRVGDLLYGLLLPSGNDAAVALAEHFGPRFPAEKSAQGAEARFVAEMNRQAQALQMKETKYFDPHGLGKNHSSAGDLATLAGTALKNPLFARYVQTRRHSCEVAEASGKKRPTTWENTNRLLGMEGYDGVKTGTTTAAGACLVASGRHAGDHLIVVVLGCAANDSRYADVRNLFRWAWRERQRK